MAITEAELIASLGKNISAICPTRFHNNSHNHCAHYVSHMLGIHFGYQCDGSTSRAGAGVSVRCNEIYNRIAQRGALGTTTPQNGWLIFATSPTNMSGDQMLSGSRKHVGIYFNGNVYNYYNDPASEQVKADTVAFFHSRLSDAYSRDAVINLYYAVLP
jgi:hypothetical protein